MIYHPDPNCDVCRGAGYVVRSEHIPHCVEDRCDLTCPVMVERDCPQCWPMQFFREPISSKSQADPPPPYDRQTAPSSLPENIVADIKLLREKEEVIRDEAIRNSARPPGPDEQIDGMPDWRRHGLYEANQLIRRLRDLVHDQRAITGLWSMAEREIPTPWRDLFTRLRYELARLHAAVMNEVQEHGPEPTELEVLRSRMSELEKRLAASEYECD
jgi:hypothetical protein